MKIMETYHASTIADAMPIIENFPYVAVPNMESFHDRQPLHISWQRLSATGVGRRGPPYALHGRATHIAPVLLVVRARFACELCILIGQWCTLRLRLDGYT